VVISQDLAAAHGREEGDFVTGVKRCVPRSELLIVGSDDRRAVFCKFRNALGVECEELLNGGGFRDFERFLGMANDVLQTAKEEDLHANRLRDRRHRGIVARAGGMQPAGGVIRLSFRREQKVRKIRWLDPGAGVA